MAKASDIKIKVDKFFTSTRVKHCANYSCHNRDNLTEECNLKYIKLDNDGKCEYYLPANIVNHIDNN